MRMSAAAFPASTPTVLAGIGFILCTTPVLFTARPS